MNREAARQAFPRGLVQPESGFRFGTDALLLACFGAPLAGTRVLDLGTGCGPAGLGLLLARRDRDTRVIGLDKEPAMVEAATENARRLGLANQFSVRLLDVRTIREATQLPPEAFDLVLANPPYRHPDSGRRPEDQGRDAARFETDGGLAAFAAAASYALRNKGQLACVYLAERLGHALSVFSANNLEIKRILPVAPRPDAPAKQVLLLARKNGRPGLRLDTPLALYEGTGPDTRLRDAALRFCPFLACNAGKQAFPPVLPTPQRDG
jgi:tRNA1Val (adenine37-N6)-methyltransferase